MPDVMTTEEASAYLRLSVQAIKQRAREGRMPAAKVGRTWRFLKSALDRWLAGGADLYEEQVDEGLGYAALEALQDARNQGKRVPIAEVKARLGQ